MEEKTRTVSHRDLDWSPAHLAHTYTPGLEVSVESSVKQCSPVINASDLFLPMGIERSFLRLVGVRPGALHRGLKKYQERGKVHVCRPHVGCER